MNKEKQLFTTEVVVVVAMSTLLLITAIYLFFDRNFNRVEYIADAPQTNNVPAQPMDNVGVDDTVIQNDTVVDNDTDLTYKRLGVCKDHDVTAPYFVKSFAGNYLYSNNRPIADYCIEELETTQLVEHYCSDEGELMTETYRCQHGCMLGACLTEQEGRGYAASDVGDGSVSWTENGVEYSIVGGFYGEQFAPLNTEDSTGQLVPLGRLVNGLALILNIENKNQVSTCAPLSLKRVVDESGRKIAPNVSEFNFEFSGGGCELPANTMTQYKILFITDVSEKEFVITAGKDNSETFIITANQETGQITLDQTVPMG